MSKNLLILLEIQVGQDLAPLALNLALDSSTHITIKNEVFSIFCKDTKWILAWVKLA
jgi:hypothetical protein